MSDKKLARRAGWLYLLMGLGGIFGMVYVPAVLIVPGDAAETATRLARSELLLRAGVIGNLISQAAFVPLAITLYRLFKRVQPFLAALMAAWVTAAVAIACLSMLFLPAALLPLEGAGYWAGFDRAQREAMSMQLIDLHGGGIHVAEMFWGLWLLPLGVLVFQSGFLPKALGVLLVVGCCGYLVSFAAHVLFPYASAFVSPIASTLSAVGEVSFILWLIVFGARTSGSKRSEAAGA